MKRSLSGQVFDAVGFVFESKCQKNFLIHFEAQKEALRMAYLIELSFDVFSVCDR